MTHNSPVERTQVTAKDVRMWVLNRRDPFTVSEMISEVGAARVTVMKALQRMIDDGEVVGLGAPAAHQGAGRPPILYCAI